MALPILMIMAETGHGLQHPLVTVTGMMETCAVVICAYPSCHLYSAAELEPTTMQPSYICLNQSQSPP
jgi:hypothetical protein